MNETYELRDFGCELLAEIDQGFDIPHIANWVNKQLIRNSPRLGKGVRDKMLEVMVIGEGPEFEMTETELRDVALALIEGYDLHL